ncbi:hypothetical protein TSOC111612_10015 [Tsukamurella ocularis]
MTRTRAAGTLGSGLVVNTVESSTFVVLWSSGAVAASFGLAHISPQAFLLLRAAGTTVVAWGVASLIGSAVPRGRDLKTVVLAGLLIQVGYQGFFFLALANGITPGLLAVIIATQPLVMVLLTLRASVGRLAGVALGLTGVTIAVAADLTGGRVSAVAIGYALAAVTAISVGTLAQTSAPAAGTWVSLAVQSTVSTAVFGVIVACAGLGVFALSWTVVASVGWLVVVVSVAATALMYRIAHQQGAVAVSALMLLVPAATALEDYLARGVALSPPVILGGLVSVAGIAVLFSADRKSLLRSHAEICPQLTEQNPKERMMTTAPTTATADTYTVVRSLAESVAQSRAADNDFYRLWMTTRLLPAQVELFAVNFHAHVAPTVDRLTQTFVRPHDVEARAETIENIFDEMGHGHADQVHAALAERFLDSLLTAVNDGRPTRLAEATAPVLPTTRRLIDEGMDLFASDVHTSLGALMAQEWHAYTHLVKLYEGVRLYRDGYQDLDSFHEHCEFFYLHIGSAEKEHKIQSLASTARVCDTPEALAAMTSGLNRYLQLLEEYWTGLYVAIRAAG